MNNSQTMVSRVFTVITVVALVFALNVSGALAGFWRSVGSVNPTEFLFGYGQGDNGTFGYGYGYGYGEGDFDAGYLTQTETTTPVTRTSTGVTATIPSGTTVTRASSASGVTLNLADIVTTTKANNTVTLARSTTRFVFDFGIPNLKMNFSIPVPIQVNVGTGLNGRNLLVGVRHYGDSSFGTSGLTTIAGDSCMAGVAGTTGNNYTVVGGQITIYTCSASEFVVYENTGGSSGGSVPDIDDNSNVSGGSGGSSKDRCPDGDLSGSNYDGTCLAVNSEYNDDDIVTDTDEDEYENTGGSSGGSVPDIDDNSNVSGGSGGSSKDRCPDGDLSGSNYDGTCLAVNSEYNDDDIVTDTDEDEEDENGNPIVSGTDSEDTIRNEGSCSFDDLSTNYTDISDSWARSYIRDLSKRGIMNGVNSSAANPGGEFEPERAVTRAEFLKIAVKSFCYDYSELSGSENFADVENGSWIAKVVELAGALDVIDTTNANFRPNDPVSKIEATKMILRIAETRSTKFTVDESVMISTFPDVTIPWMKKYAEKAQELDIIDGNGGYFEPTIAITRAQTSKIAVRSMNAQ